MTDRRLRVGVIGLGGIGRVHLTGYQKNKKCKLISVASGTKEHATEAAKNYKIENSYWDDDWKIMIKEDNLD
ncbi:MAG: hypothetical protein GF383_13995, partial [Candidatus Lokiarchaeota archaeon]|nr:hypothetical protein [Candidatus Lokiarchaeota archaeon]MBD3342439.1 hypothetical protein [Candidatus Lokiarchaeota archaeon]